jgi:Cation efflux family
MNNPLSVAIGGIFVSVLELGVKYPAYWLTGSIALYSDALESIVNVVTTIIAVLAVRILAKPADANEIGFWTERVAVGTWRGNQTERTGLRKLTMRMLKLLRNTQGSYKRGDRRQKFLQTYQ